MAEALGKRLCGNEKPLFRVRFLFPTPTRSQMGMGEWECLGRFIRAFPSPARPSIRPLPAHRQPSRVPVAHGAANRSACRPPHHGPRSRRHGPVAAMIGVLPEREAGTATEEACRWHGIDQQTLHRRTSDVLCMAVSDSQMLKALKPGNRRLKQRLADSVLEVAAPNEVSGRTETARNTPGAIERSRLSSSLDRPHIGAWPSESGCRALAPSGRRWLSARPGRLRRPAAPTNARFQRQTWRAIRSERASSWGEGQSWLHYFSDMRIDAIYLHKNTQ